MEATIDKAINMTVATSVDKTVTGATEITSPENIGRAAEERVKAAEEQVKILEDKVKDLEEKLKVAEEIKVCKDTFATGVDNAVEEKVKDLEEVMRKKIYRATRMAKLQAQFDSVSNKTIAQQRY